MEFTIVFSFYPEQLQELDEKKLIKNAQKGNSGAFELLVRKHQHRLYPYALTVTSGDHAIACDILQDALLKAWLKIDKLDPESSFFAWVWKIVKNQFIDYHRSSKTRHVFSLESVPDQKLSMDEDSEKELIIAEKKKNLIKAVGQLSEKYRELIILIDFENMSYEEAGAILKLPISTIKTRLYRAREKLAEIVHKNRKLFR